MLFQLNDSSASWKPGDVLTGAREVVLTSALTALVGYEAADTLLRLVGPNGLEHMDAAEIASSGGVSLHLAERVVAGRDLTVALRDRTLPGGPAPERLLAALPPDFGRLEREVLLGMALTAHHRVKAVVVLSVGGLAGTALLPCDVFTPMIRHAASGFAICHNHPSGDRLPSHEDISFTNALSTMGALLGIPLVDHLVVARDGFTSFAESGLLLDETELPKTRTIREMGGAS